MIARVTQSGFALPLPKQIRTVLATPGEARVLHLQRLKGGNMATKDLDAVQELKRAEDQYRKAWTRFTATTSNKTLRMVVEALEEIRAVQEPLWRRVRATVGISLLVTRRRR